jgi:hypothetical protein
MGGAGAQIKLRTKDRLDATLAESFGEGGDTRKRAMVCDRTRLVAKLFTSASNCIWF